jgi:hypothetical protein
MDEEPSDSRYGGGIVPHSHRRPTFPLSVSHYTSPGSHFRQFKAITSTFGALFMRALCILHESDAYTV